MWNSNNNQRDSWRYSPYFSNCGSRLLSTTSIPLAQLAGCSDHGIWSAKLDSISAPASTLWHRANRCRLNKPGENLEVIFHVLASPQLHEIKLMLFLYGKSNFNCCYSCLDFLPATSTINSSARSLNRSILCDKDIFFGKPLANHVSHDIALFIQPLQGHRLAFYLTPKGITQVLTHIRTNSLVSFCMPDHMLFVVLTALPAVSGTIT